MIGDLTVWGAVLRLQAVFAVFGVLLLYYGKRRLPEPGAARRLLGKLVLYYLITHLCAALLLAGGPWLRGLVVLVGMAGCRELIGVLLPGSSTTRPYAAIAAVGCAVALLLLPNWPGDGGLTLGALLVLLALPVLLRQPAGAHVHVPGALLIVLVAGLLPTYLLRLRGEHGAGAALFAYVLIVLNDGFAEVCGRLFGRRPFFKAISPNKTLEGAIGGAAVTLVGAWLFRGLLGPASATTLVALTAAVVVSGTIGDLVFSAIKRSVGKKDFDSTLAAHGGVLDRFDSLLFAAPVVYLLLPLLHPAGG